jgi:transposase-like protein
MLFVQSTASTRYKCQFCEKTYDDGRKLGGHTAKAHKAQLAAKK